MIGVFGGTFDPVHYGHLETVSHVQKLLQLAQVRIIPLKTPVHRPQPQASSEQRLKMVQAACSEYPSLTVDDREINSSQASYTVYTVESLKAEFPEEPICLIIGSDAFNHFKDWLQPERILQLAHLVIMQRSGHPLTFTPPAADIYQANAAANSDALYTCGAGKILMVEVPEIDISSTQIRQRRRANLTIDGLTPGSVIDLIQTWDLYRDSTAA